MWVFIGKTQLTPMNKRHALRRTGQAHEEVGSSWPDPRTTNNLKEEGSSLKHTYEQHMFHE